MNDKVKSYGVIISTLLFIGCNSSSTNDAAQRLPENSKTIQVQLIDSLGTITLSVPARYDTGFSWVHYSDCGKPCNEQKYRFQSKELPVIKESGWIWLDEPKDSVERFTISHAGYFPFHEGDTSKNVAAHKHLKEQLQSGTLNPPIVFDTIQKINDRYFSIIVMEQSGATHSAKVLAVTTIKSNKIKFLYELLTTKKDSIASNFNKNSIDLLKTIRISKGI